MKGKSKSTKNSSNTTPTTLQSGEQEFLLRPLSSRCHYYEEIRLSLRPEYNRKSKNYMKVWPQINADGKDYMPFFLLDVDKDSVWKREGQYRQSQRQRIQNAMESKSQILVPHPGKNRHTCFVCKSHYNDYRIHVQTKSHKAKLRSSKSESIIDDLISIVQRQRESSLENIDKKQKTDMKPQAKKQINIQKLIEAQTQFTNNFPSAEDTQRVQFQLADLQGDIEIQQLKFIQPTEPSLNKNDQNQTLLNCYISNLNSFRVSDYLI